MEWSEELPLQCPPEKAVPPENVTFYRFVSSTPLKEEDFFSLRKMCPAKVFNVDECTVRAISVHDTIEASKSLLKFPRFKKMKLVEISLTPESGVVLQTGKDSSHYSWWRAKSFLPASYAQVG